MQPHQMFHNAVYNAAEKRRCRHGRAKRSRPRCRAIAVPFDCACEYEMKASHPVAMRALSTRRTTGRKGAGQAALAAVLCLAITMSTQRS